MQTVAIPDRVYTPSGVPVSTALILCGEIRNFSSEQRWTLQSHVSGIVRLYNQQGTLPGGVIPGVAPGGGFPLDRGEFSGQNGQAPSQLGFRNRGTGSNG